MNKFKDILKNLKSIVNHTIKKIFNKIKNIKAKKKEITIITTSVISIAAIVMIGVTVNDAKNVKSDNAVKSDNTTVYAETTAITNSMTEVTNITTTVGTTTFNTSTSVTDKSTTTTVTTTSKAEEIATTAVKTTTKITETVKEQPEFLVLNEEADSRRVHRSSCMYYSDWMTRIEGDVIDVEARPCKTCNPDIEFTNLYVPADNNLTDNSNSSSSTEENISVNTGSSGSAYISCPLSSDLNQYIYDLSNSYGVPYPLVMAVIRQESNFQADAYNSSGCVGLMQIMSCYNTDVNLWDPYQNVQRGIEILSRCYYKAGCDITWTYTYYHFGEYYSGSSPSPYAYKIVNYYNEYCG